MIRTRKTAFMTNSFDRNRLYECNLTSAIVWNDCLEIAKSYHQEHGTWINRTKLQKRTKGRYPLHSQSIQAICHQYLWNRDSTKKAKDKGLTGTRYPYKKKRHFNTTWAKDGFQVYENGKIELSMGIWQGKRQKPIPIWIKEIPQGVIKEIELIYDRKLMVCLTYEDGLTADINNHHLTSAIDVGEIHAIASVTEGHQGIIITGRKMRSIKRLRNKKVAELQRKMSKCKKGSKQWEKYQRAKQYILSKSDAQLTDSLHKISKQYVQWCVKQQVKQVVIGKVDGVQRNTSVKKKKNPAKKKRNRLVTQKLSQWQFGKLQDYLAYKLKAKGMTMKQVDESYTSQTCPVCTRRKKAAGRVYRCPCGYEQHRDIHGASNILTQFLHGQMKPMEVKKGHVKYLRVS